MGSLDPHEYEPPERWRYDETRCRACRARIVFLRRGASRIPLDVSTRRSRDDGRETMRSHFLSCPRASSLGKKKRSVRSSAEGQRSLF